MMSGILSRTDLLLLPRVSLTLFVGIFVGMVVWIFRPGASKGYEARARMALDTENGVSHVEP
jgi:cbb3-type cytochrome oxidase subunit 3